MIKMEGKEQLQQYLIIQNFEVISLNLKNKDFDIWELSIHPSLPVQCFHCLSIAIQVVLTSMALAVSQLLFYTSTI